MTEILVITRNIHNVPKCLPTEILEGQLVGNLGNDHLNLIIKS